MNFFTRHKCKFRRFAGCKSRNLHAADGEKGIARRAAELYGVALRQSHTDEGVRWRANFSSDAAAHFEGLLDANQKFCRKQTAKKASQRRCQIVWRRLKIMPRESARPVGRLINITPTIFRAYTALKRLRGGFSGSIQVRPNQTLHGAMAMQSLIAIHIPFFKKSISIIAHSPTSFKLAAGSDDRGSIQDEAALPGI